ncbi:hypothetical protein [Streptomyces sp. CT34]|uniref:hypothetical protein n=1 Tax=Streptomyces sp. CT34 TaxID=1553907 RepID=UPI0012FEFD2C|nr:hypothetical protein [Streptomyces sp. CT34]
MSRLNGTYIRKQGDAQVVNLPLKNNTDNAHLFRLHIAGKHAGNNLYSIESLETHLPSEPALYMSVNPDNVADGIRWVDPKTVSGKAAKALLWYIVPQPCGGVALLPGLDPSYGLGFIDKNPGVNVCGRPTELIYGWVPVMNTWDITGQRDRECPPTKIPEV